MNTEAEIGVMHLQAKESKGSLAATTGQERGREQILPQSFKKERTLLTL